MLLLRKIIIVKSKILAELDVAETTKNVAAKSSEAGLGSSVYTMHALQKYSLQKSFFT